MAGFMSRLTHRVYEGRFMNKTGADLANGMLVVLTPDTTNHTVEVKLPAANKGAFVVVEKRDVFEGTPGLALHVVDPDELYLVENLILINESNEEWDGATYVVADGKRVRIHKLEAGEEVTTDQLAALPSTYEVGDTLKSAATGKFTA